MTEPFRSNVETVSYPSPGTTRSPFGIFFLVTAVSLSMVQYAFMVGFVTTGIVQIQGELGRVS